VGRNIDDCEASVCEVLSHLASSECEELMTDNEVSVREVLLSVRRLYGNSIDMVWRLYGK
jgi:hypothetical protein